MDGLLPHSDAHAIVASMSGTASVEGHPELGKQEVCDERMRHLRAD